LLLVGALAGMTVGAVAHAQVAFRSASSATQPVPTFRAASSATAVVPAPVPTFVAAGAVAANTGAITPALPAGIAVDDILLLFLETSNQAITIANQNGGTWTAVANSPQSTGTATNADATRLTVFWSRHNGTQTAPVTSDSGNHQLGRMIAVRGVDTTGNPWDITAGGVEAGNGDTSGSIPGATTTVANALVVAAIATSLPDANGTTVFSAWANAGLTGVNERTDDSTSAGDGGALGIATGVRATAGAYGATTVTTSVSTAKAMMSIALRPQLTITINKPAGTIQNDVMIASFGFRTNQPGLSTDVGITPPTGWTLVRRLDNPGPTDNGIAVYQRVAGAAEPASYTWGLTCIATCATNGFGSAAGGIASFSNVNTTTPVDVENGQITAVGAQTAPSVTTTVTNAMLVASYSYATAGTWTPPAASGGDAAMTEAVDIISGNQSTEMSYVLHAAAGATAAKQATPNPDDDEGNAHILALRPALQSTITINKPAGTIQNDVMIASIGFSPNTLTIPTVPAGWTLVRRVDNPNANANSLVVYWKTAGAAEPANYAWTFSAAGYLAGSISTFSGVDTTTPVDIENGNCTQQGSCATTTLSHATPSVTTTVANTMLVTSHTYSSAGTWAPPGAMTEAVEVQHGNQSLGVNYVLQAAIGATGAKTATASAQADVGNAHILALRPAVVVVPPPGDFNAFETSTGAGAITGQIYTKLAGTAFSLDAVAILGGVQQAAFTNTVQVDLVTGSTGGLNCPGTPVTIAGTTQSVNLTSGRGTTGAFNVANAYRDVRVRVRFPVASPTVTSCSTDNFTIRPAAFSAPTSSMTNAGTSGVPVAKAGAAFTITAVAIAGYDGTPSTDNTKITAHAGAIQNGAVGGTFGAANPATGTATGAAFTYSEVGNFTIAINGVLDNTFTNASTDQGNGDCTANFSNSLVGGRYGCYFGNSSASAVIGRFTPDHFDVSLNTPTFATGCGPGNYTYVGQTFSYTVQPVITVTAKNAAGLGNATTQNYTGASWFKLTNASLTGKSYTAATGTLNSGGVPGTDPVVADTGAGTASITFGSGTGLLFTRSTPIAPFNSEISLAINVIDGDTPAIVYALNPTRFSAATPGNGIAFNNGKQMRFGRLAIRNANGSLLVPLPAQVEAQYWSGAPTNAFITNTADSCTAIATNNVEMSNFTNNLAACETANTAVTAFSSGRSILTLAAPGAGNNGSVDLAVNLSGAISGTTCTTVGGGTVPAAGANRAYLQGNWTGGAYNQNPSARATFGVFKGPEEVIFIRENF
jgi:MSHA biogenesis protein MshQ